MFIDYDYSGIQLNFEELLLKHRILWFLTEFPLGLCINRNTIYKTNILKE